MNTNIIIIKPKSVDILELISNKENKLSDNIQSILINTIKDSFTEEEQRWYISNFYMYMNYHPTTDFPINLDNVFNMIGFANKGNALKTIKNNFTVNEDYKQVVIHLENNLKGGRPLEEIMLNIDTFKTLCMLAKTDKGKEIRKYYVKLENIYNKILKEEFDVQNNLLKEKENEILLLKEKSNNELEEKEHQLAEALKAVINEDNKKNKLLNRRHQNEEKRDIIYLYKDNKDESNNLYKIGKTKNISQREVHYSNMCKNGEVVYIKYCQDCTLAEKMIHHTLNYCRWIQNQEWFYISKENAIKAINKVIELDNTDIQLEQEDIQIIKVPNIVKEIIDIKNNPIDFEKFITDCFEIDINFNCPTDSISEAHRVWCRGSRQKLTITNLNNYMNNNFKTTTLWENNTRKLMYKTLKIKPLIYTPTDLTVDYQNFIVEECGVNYHNRVSYSDFFDYFTIFKQKTEPEYILKSSYKKEIQHYLESVFCGGRAHTSTATSKAKHLHGIYGIGFITNNFGSKIRVKTTTIIEQYNAVTGTLIKTWESLSLASEELKIPRSTLSNYARFETNKDGFIYKHGVKNNI